MIRFSSARFSPRLDHTWPEHGPSRVPRVTKRKLTLLPVRTELRGAGVAAPAGEVRR